MIYGVCIIDGYKMHCILPYWHKCSDLMLLNLQNLCLNHCSCLLPWLRSHLISIWLYSSAFLWWNTRINSNISSSLVAPDQDHTSKVPSWTLLTGTDTGFYKIIKKISHILNNIEYLHSYIRYLITKLKLDIFNTN